MYTFASITDTKYVRIKRVSGTGSEAYKRGKIRLSNYYLIMHNGIPLTIESGEFILFDKKTKKIGVQAFQLPSSITLNASQDCIYENVQKFFRAWHQRN